MASDYDHSEGMVIEAHFYDEEEAEAFKDLFESLEGVAMWKFEQYEDSGGADAE